MAIPEAKPPDRPTLAAATTAGMLELGRRFAAARPEVSIVLTPHNVHVEGAMAVIDAAAVAGDLAQSGTPLALKVPVDREIAHAAHDAIRAAGIPVVYVSYGANDPAAAIAPMDWAVQVPAHFMGGRSDPQIPVVVIAPARDLSDELHVRAGQAIGKAAASSSKRVALVASCDHGHGHDAKGPYGYTSKSKEFDDRLVETAFALQRGRKVFVSHGTEGVLSDFFLGLRDGRPGAGAVPKCVADELAEVEPARAHSEEDEAASENENEEHERPLRLIAQAGKEHRVLRYAL